MGRFGNAFWSLLLQLATQVRVPGAGDAAVTWTSRAALRWGVIPLNKKINKNKKVQVSFARQSPLPFGLHVQARA